MTSGLEIVNEIEERQNKRFYNKVDSIKKMLDKKQWKQLLSLKRKVLFMFKDDKSLNRFLEIDLFQAVFHNSLSFDILEKTINFSGKKAADNGMSFELYLNTVVAEINKAVKEQEIKLSEKDKLKSEQMLKEALGR